MARLVEILARYIVLWPERVVAMEQCAMGEVIEAGNPARVYCVTEKADFAEVVTRREWEVERAKRLDNSHTTNSTT